jgi:hypothetical protein
VKATYIQTYIHISWGIQSSLGRVLTTGIDNIRPVPELMGLHRNDEKVNKPDKKFSPKEKFKK